MDIPTFPSTASAAAHFALQGTLEPGQEGFWKVYGAKVNNIREGDLILTQGEEGEATFTYIKGTFTAKAAPMRKGLIDDKGEQFTLGALLPVIVLRWDKHNLLA